MHISLSKLQSHELTFLISDTVNFFHMCGADDDDNGGLNVGGLLLCMRLLTAGWPTCVNKASADSKSQHCFYTIKSFMAEVEVAAAVGCRSLSTIEATSEATSKASVVRF